MPELTKYRIMHCPTTVFVETEGSFAGAVHIMMYPTSSQQQEEATKAIVDFAAAHNTTARVTESSVSARASDHSVTITMFPTLTANNEEITNGDQKTTT